MGYVNKSGMEIDVEPAYSRVYDFHNGKSFLALEREKINIRL